MITYCALLGTLRLLLLVSQHGLFGVCVNCCALNELTDLLSMLVYLVWLIVHYDELEESSLQMCGAWCSGFMIRCQSQGG
jgi:hypothetical protein